MLNELRTIFLARHMAKAFGECQSDAIKQSARATLKYFNNESRSVIQDLSKHSSDNGWRVNTVVRMEQALREKGLI